MKKHFINLIPVPYIIIFIIIFNSCGSVPETIKIEQNEKNIDKVQNVVLLSTMIGKVDEVSIDELPGSGLIGAITDQIDKLAINEKIESISDSIINLQKQKIDKYREIVAFNLRNNFKCNVLFADSLVSSKSFAEIKDKYNKNSSLKTEDKDFPEIIKATGEINCFNFKKGDVVNYFENEKNYKTIISKIADKLNSDFVVISYTNLNIVGDHGVTLETYLYFFDKSGDLLTMAFNRTLPSKIKFDEVKHYRKELDEFQNILQPLMKKVASNYKKSISNK